MYHVCPICGAALDPGEQCEDCQERTESKSMMNKKTAPVLEHRERHGGTGFDGHCFHLQSIGERGGLQA